MTKKVTLTVDRNGRVDTISPEAVQLKPGKSVRYTLREPTDSTNWRFIGVQFSEDANDFSAVEISDGGNSLTLIERADRTDSDHIECTLLYTLKDSTYYPAGNIDPEHPNPLTALPIHAFDPLILNMN